MQTTNEAARTDRTSLAFDSNINLSVLERRLSVALGTALACLGFGRASKGGQLLCAGVGAALLYRGLAGHCHVYEFLGIDSALDENEDSRQADDIQSKSQQPQVAVKNQVDKDRFDKLKTTQIERGRDEDKAVEVAAKEVKELRRREGRSKEDKEELWDEQFDKEGQ